MSISCPFLPSLSSKPHSSGWFLQALPAQILIKVSHKTWISNEPLIRIPLEIRVAALSVVLFLSMVLLFEYRRPLFWDFLLYVNIQRWNCPFLTFCLGISGICHWRYQNGTSKRCVSGDYLILHLSCIIGDWGCGRFYTGGLFRWLSPLLLEIKTSFVLAS